MGWRELDLFFLFCFFGGGGGGLFSLWIYVRGWDGVGWGGVGWGEVRCEMCSLVGG